MTAAVNFKSNSLDTRPTNPARRDRRLPIRLEGRFLDESGEEHSIVSIAMSSRSGQLQTTNIPAVGSRIVCYFDGLGRLAGEVMRGLPNGFLMRFSQTAHKRDKLADQLVWLINKDRLGLSDERQHTRYAAGGMAHLRLEKGGILICRVLDISLTSAGFEAVSQAPPIGEVVYSGNLRGEVVRSQGQSFGVRFIRGLE